MHAQTPAKPNTARSFRVRRVEPRRSFEPRPRGAPRPRRHFEATENLHICKPAATNYGGRKRQAVNVPDPTYDTIKRLDNKKALNVMSDSPFPIGDRPLHFHGQQTQTSKVGRGPTLVSCALAAQPKEILEPEPIFPPTLVTKISRRAMKFLKRISQRAKYTKRPG